MIRLLLALALVVTTYALAAGDPKDLPGSKDPANFTRMQGFRIAGFEAREFDRFEFPVAAGKTTAVEGRHVYVDYYLNDGAGAPSALQIARNYTSAAKAVGGSVVYEYEDGGSQYATLKLSRGDAETWAFVEGAPNGMYKIHVVEKQTMRQDVVASAGVMASGLKATGHIALYGIYFDTNQAQIKPASDPALAEISKLLRSEAGLTLYVVGHTDNQGAFDHNLRLSQNRAAAVVAALGRIGVDANRLKAFGAGPTAPVASNDTEQGRAKNRRVELVAQ